MDWTTRINQAIDYIEENLEDDIDLKYAAQLACCSLNNFTNMFLVTTGIQVSEYIRRRHLRHLNSKIAMKRLLILL